jgi:hypothetical protein
LLSKLGKGCGLNRNLNLAAESNTTNYKDELRILALPFGMPWLRLSVWGISGYRKPKIPLDELLFSSTLDAFFSNGIAHHSNKT